MPLSYILLGAILQYRYGFHKYSICACIMQFVYEVSDIVNTVLTINLQCFRRLDNFSFVFLVGFTKYQYLNSAN